MAIKADRRKIAVEAILKDGGKVITIISEIFHPVITRNQSRMRSRLDRFGFGTSWAMTSLPAWLKPR